LSDNLHKCFLPVDIYLSNISVSKINVLLMKVLPVTNKHVIEVKHIKTDRKNNYIKLAYPNL